ncbi:MULTISPECIES: DUF2147 domain-containing protein [Cellulophaga]|jgi:uncharacterized protein (DUF2147 family)|uniref:Uncharacterized conserved protein, DUF2147 family n=2 Tax=Cellulophaga baltica TaxID=76594 RepID=A0A1G7KF97_9FLAO|nr:MULTISPECIES: DUF2147 domain-containing protein [Cellulophaga]AIZ43264.1 signal peptide protein [Cellulophaga baltica 18]KGK30310.1 signal peptide protein [Cellulophaga sp. E6(2014)]MCR1026526.1 DUF2147 domain-containing protein [Cellulophaga baltica]QXP53493.1 DUF2147 domain-containing protein [Cellulophaga sp. HaHa_2_1]SDF35948.1 Uncharacterized conserved protein, DUF2147 family [Cellulophaga baltica]
MKHHKLLLFFIGLFLINFSYGQSIFDEWKTIDDRTGKPKGVIKIYKKDGQMYGDIVKVLEEGKENFKCTKCEGDLKDAPVLGMTIIKGAEDDGDGEWKGKYLFDPEQAMTFRCKIWLNPDNPDELKVRGYLAFIYRTQTWIRVKD